MKRTSNQATLSAEMALEYDFSGGVRGKYAKRYAHGTNVVVLDPDVAKLFPDSETVNRSLRALASIIRIQQNSPGASTHPTARFAGVVRGPKGLSSRKGFASK